MYILKYYKFLKKGTLRFDHVLSEKNSVVYEKWWGNTKG